MSISGDLLSDGFGRVEQSAASAVDGLSQGELGFRVDPDSNTVAWLVWHLARVQDDHISELAGRDQVWFTNSWRDVFDLPFDKKAIGYGQSSEEVGALASATAKNLTGYLRAVSASSLSYLETLQDSTLDDVIDDSWEPPVMRGVRLVSVLDDCLQHAGQAAFIRGVVKRGR